MKHIHKTNKKGQIDDWFDYLFTVLVLFFLFFFLSGIFGSNTTQVNDNLIEDISILEGNKMLLPLLDAPVIYQNVSMTYKELIIFSEKEILVSQRENGISQISRSIFDPIFGEKKWTLNICHGEYSNYGCSLYINRNEWDTTIRGKKGNLHNEGIITFKDHTNRDITITLRVFS